jgi:hypothetical protein
MPPSRILSCGSLRDLGVSICLVIVIRSSGRFTNEGPKKSLIDPCLSSLA